MKLLFVCTGNTCRSVMAETLFNEFNKDERISCSSEGLSIVENSVASKYTASILMEKYSVNVSNRNAVQVNYDTLKNADLILTMTYAIKYVLGDKYPEFKDKIFTLKEYLGEKVNPNISDPFGGDIDDYTKVHDEIENYIKLLIKKLKN